MSAMAKIISEIDSDAAWKARQPTIKRLESYIDDILDIVVKNWDYFKPRPVHLAWAMMQYELAHRASRQIDDCTGNPKYPICDAGDKMTVEGDGDLLYDAWAVCISNDYNFPDANPDLPIESKKNKTVQDWIDLQLNPDYKYCDLYGDGEERVIDRLLCIIGSGLGWNKDGFIDDTGPSGVCSATFAGYTRAAEDIREDLFQEIVALSHNNELITHVKEIWEEHLIRASNDRPAIKALGMASDIRWETRKGKLTHPIDELLEASKYLCYFEELCRRSQRWTIEEWAEMRKKEVVEVNGFEMKVADFRDDFHHPASMMRFLRLGGHEDELESKIDARIDRYRSFSGVNWIKDKLKEDPSLDVDLFLDLVVNTNVVKGWAAIKHIFSGKKEREYSYKLLMEDEEIQVNVMNASRASLFKDLGLDMQPPKERSKFYPICEYSPVWRMPKNAHKSYVEAAVIHLRKIVADPLTETCVLPYAFRILRRLRRKPYNRSDKRVQKGKMVRAQKKYCKVKHE
ncbi:hypothetical protein LCGC14_0547050 [marine sediment metagenome]|uniref:Uncharacterized protein n=1 Tax=marine sediment metagenome TaxID=412755 RepID=A0A0F9UZ79_9ZZZZ